MVVMNNSSESTTQLIESIKALPPESLAELSSFVRYLQFKNTENSKVTGKDFLLSIAGMGESGEIDISERDEEILGQEVDPIRGWSKQIDASS